MSPIGRVFIVLNLILAVAFLSYAAFYLKNHDHYKAMYTELKDTTDTTIANLNSELTEKQSTIESVKGELLAKTNAHDVAKRDITTLEQDNSSLKKQLDGYNTQLTEVAGKLGTVQQDLAKSQARIVSATDKWLESEKNTAAAVADRDDYENKLRAAEASLKRSKEREASLVAELGEKNVELRKKSTELAVILETIPAASKIVARALPKVDGTIMDVNDELKSVVISLGENQAEVTAGWKFAVHDGTNYKGEISITDVSANMAYGRIHSPVPGQTIQKGDKASTRLPR